MDPNEIEAKAKKPTPKVGRLIPSVEKQTPTKTIEIIAPADIKTEAVNGKPVAKDEKPKDKQDQPKAKLEEKPKGGLKESADVAGEEVKLVEDYFLYLAQNFNAKQFCDFYWIIANMELDYQKFMDLERNSAFAKVYNDTQAKIKEGLITFGFWRDTVNKELALQVCLDEKDTLTWIALMILLGRPRQMIYNILEEDTIEKQIDVGNYFAF